MAYGRPVAFQTLSIGARFAQVTTKTVGKVMVLEPDVRCVFTKIEAQPDNGWGCCNCETENVWNADNGNNHVHFCPHEKVFPVEEVQ